jgi:hypothetical protein
MKRNPMAQPAHLPLQRAGFIPKLFIVSAAAIALVACGGGSSGGGGTTTFSGAVVKGPVNGARVCAFALSGNAPGAALGSCVTTDFNGN